VVCPVVFREGAAVNAAIQVPEFGANIHSS
jgi:hypothetical protein